MFTIDPRKYKEINELEFGHEVEFFEKKGAAPRNTVLSGKPAKRYDLTLDKVFKVTLWTTAEGAVPMQISCTDRHDHDHQTIEYLTFKKDIEFKPELFEPPEGIKYVESPAWLQNPFR